MQKTRTQPKPRLLSLAAIIASLYLATDPASAQIARRNFANPSFEDPVLDTACTAPGDTLVQIDANALPGWETTHSEFTPTTPCGGPTPYRPIELWESGFEGITSLPTGGNQFAELNANEPSRIYQTSCLLANETVGYSYYHRARSASPETSRAVLFDDTGSTQIDQGPDDSVNVADGWVLHTGTLTNNGVTGPRQIGFISIAGGTLGNLLDLVEVQLRPLTELVASSNTPTPEDGGSASFSFVVNGELENAATFTFVLDGASTATPDDFSVATGALTGRGTIDSYSTTDGTITITLPAGFYNPNDVNNVNGEQGVFTIPLTFSTDATIEPDETIIYRTGTVITGGGNSAARDLQFNDTNCDGSIVPTVNTVIQNDDNDLALSTSLDTPGPYAPGTQVTYTFTVSNAATGAATATNAVITSSLSNLLIDSVSSTNCSTFPCTIPSLPQGGSEIITVLATIQSAGTFGTSASVSADQSDANTANNSALAGNAAVDPAARASSVPSTYKWSVALMMLGMALLGYVQLSRKWSH